MVESSPQITGDVQPRKSHKKKAYPVLQVKQYTPSAEIKNTLKTQLGIT
jgi:hypothetical protein